MSKTTDDLARFMRHVDIQPNGCWRWTATLSTRGYGLFYSYPKQYGAHRWFYMTTVRPLERSEHLDHVCHDGAACRVPAECLHRRCVNPEHLEPVTQAENNARMHAQRGGSNVEHMAMMRAAARAAYQAAPHCKHGHEWTPENTVVQGRGTRLCRTCRNDRKRAYRLSARL